MNETPKVVVSHKSFVPDWQNTTVICDDLVDELSKLKVVDSNTIVLGSNNLCETLILEGLLDEVQIVVNPVLLGDGTPLFKGLSKTTELILKETTVFESGKVLLVYELTG